MECSHPFDMLWEVGLDRARQHRHPVLAALAVADRDLVRREVDVLIRSHSRRRACASGNAPPGTPEGDVQYRAGRLSAHGRPDRKVSGADAVAVGTLRARFERATWLLLKGLLSCMFVQSSFLKLSSAEAAEQRGESAPATKHGFESLSTAPVGLSSSRRACFASV